jgi:hypothetical protein
LTDHFCRCYAGTRESPVLRPPAAVCMC